MPTSRYFKPREETYLPMATKMWYADQRQKKLDYETGQSQLDALNTGLSQVRAYGEEDEAALQQRKDYYSERINQAITSTKGRPTNMLPHIRQINRDFQQDFGSGELYGIGKKYGMAQEDMKRMEGRIAAGTLNEATAGIQRGLIGTGRQVPNAPDFNKDIPTIVRMGESAGMKTPADLARFATEYMSSQNAEYFNMLNEADPTGAVGEYEMARMQNSINALTNLSYDADEQDSAEAVSAMLRGGRDEEAFDAAGMSLEIVDDVVQPVDVDAEAPFLMGDEDYTKQGKLIPRERRVDERIVPGHQVVSGDQAMWVKKSIQKTLIPGTTDYVDDEGVSQKGEITRANEIRKSFNIDKGVSDKQIAEDWNSFRSVEGYVEKLYKTKSDRPDLYDINLHSQLYNKDTKEYGSFITESVYVDGEQLRGEKKMKQLGKLLGYKEITGDDEDAFKARLSETEPALTVSSVTGDVTYVYTVRDSDGESHRIEIPAEKSVRDQAHNTVSIAKGLKNVHDPERMKELLEEKIIQPVIDKNGVNQTEKSDYTSFYVQPKIKNLFVGDQSIDKFKVDFVYDPDSQSKFVPVITPMYYDDDRTLQTFDDEDGNHHTMSMSELTERELKMALGSKLTISGTSSKN